MEVLSRLSVEQFQERLVEHVQEVFPEECQALGEAAVKHAVRGGIDRAARYGFQTEQDIARFVDLTFIYGARFDEDPQYPWANAILSDPSYDDPTRRMDDLYDAAEEHADEAAAGRPGE